MISFTNIASINSIIIITCNFKLPTNQILLTWLTFVELITLLTFTVNNITNITNTITIANITINTNMTYYTFIITFITNTTKWWWVSSHEAWMVIWTCWKEGVGLVLSILHESIKQLFWLTLSTIRLENVYPTGGSCLSLAI